MLFMPRLSILFFALLILFVSCKQRKRITEKEIVAKPAEINKYASDIIKESLDLLEDEPVDGELKLRNVSVLKGIYKGKDYTPLWTGNGKWNSNGDSLYQLIDSARYFGLFPKDYFDTELKQLRDRLI